MHRGEIIVIALVVSCCYGSVVLDFAEEAFDEVTISIEVLLNAGLRRRCGMGVIFAYAPLADIAADKLKVYAQPQRLMILSFLLDGEKSVSDIDEATAIGQPALSQQLAAPSGTGKNTARRQASLL